jgi:hypothetical protein
MINKEKFPLYGYVCNLIAFFFFIFHFLYLLDKCPFGISMVIRISFIQLILAILAIYFGCCSKTKKAKISIILGLTLILLIVCYYILIIQPCISP